MARKFPFRIPVKNEWAPQWEASRRPAPKDPFQQAQGLAAQAIKKIMDDDFTSLTAEDIQALLNYSEQQRRANQMNPMDYIRRHAR